MLATIQQRLLLFAPAPMVLALVLGCIRFRRLPRPLQLLTGLIALACTCEVATRVLWMQKLPNLFLLPFYITAEFALLIALYREVLTGAALRRLLPLAALAFGAYSLGDFALHHRKAQFNSMPLFVESLAVTGLVLLFFRQLLRERPSQRLELYPMFWVSGGVLLYFAGNALLFLSSNYLMVYSKSLNMQVWATHAFFLFVLYSCYVVALCLPPPK